jgi:aspartate racemase
VVPDIDDRRLVNERYFDELTEGIFRDETRAEIVSVVRRMVASYAIEAVILGGTELPLLLRQSEMLELPMLDTTAIHVDAAVEWLLAD